MFYDLFCELCKRKGVSVTRATVEMGLSRTIGTKWKTTGATPNGETLNRIADYFGVTADYLLGGGAEKTPAPEGGRTMTYDDFTYAMQNETRDLTEMDKQILLSMARQLNDARKKKDGEAK